MTVQSPSTNVYIMPFPLASKAAAVASSLHRSAGAHHVTVSDSRVLHTRRDTSSRPSPCVAQPHRERLSHSSANRRVLTCLCSGVSSSAGLCLAH